MRSLKILMFSLVSLFVCSSGWGAWDASKPADNEKLKDTPALIRANWDAIATGTDASLQITNAKVSASAGIVDTKLATISTAGKVNASALTSLSSTPAGAGALPIANGGTGATTRQASLDALVGTQTGNAGKALVTDGTNASLGYPADLAIASQATGDLLYFDGTNWKRLAKGTTNYPLVAGASIPAYTQLGLTTGVTGILPVANGGTGQDTAQEAIDALLPSQTSNSGKYLTSNGTTASWGTVTPSALALVSTTTFSNATDSGNISIDPTIYDYRVEVVAYSNLDGTGVPINEILLQFNSSYSGCNSVWTGREFSGTNAITGKRAGAISLFTASSSNYELTYINSSFEIKRFDYTTTALNAHQSSIFVKGKSCIYDEHPAPILLDFAGTRVVSSSNEATSFKLVFDSAMSGKVLLYSVVK